MNRWILIIGVMIAMMLLARFVMADGQPAIASQTVTIAATGVSQALPSQFVPDGASVIVRAKSANAATVRIGKTADENFTLAAGEGVVLAVTDTRAISVVGTAGDGVEILSEARK